MKSKLGVNIDHIATVRNARSEGHPDILKAARFALNSGADFITIHVREDQRHIKKKDALILKSKIKKPINLEISTNQKMINFASKLKPYSVCIVPENRKEITTEGGLNLKNNSLAKNIKKLKKLNIKVSLFINPNLKDLKKSKILGSDSVEIHTGKFSRLVKNKNSKLKQEFSKILKCSQMAKKLKINFNLGHGLDYVSAKYLSKLKNVSEYNIGHFIIGESLFHGMKRVIKKFKTIL